MAFCCSKSQQNRLSSQMLENTKFLQGFLFIYFIFKGKPISEGISLNIESNYGWSPTHDGLTYNFPTLQWCESNTHSVETG